MRASQLITRDANPVVSRTLPGVAAAMAEVAVEPLLIRESYGMRAELRLSGGFFELRFESPTRKLSPVRTTDAYTAGIIMESVIGQAKVPYERLGK